MKMKLLYMLKAPIVGIVKTRLAASIGQAEATNAYRRMVDYQLDALQDFDSEVHYTPAESIEMMRDWLGADRKYYSQAEGDLGDRMLHATQGAFQRGSKAVCLLGGDCPYITKAKLEETTQALEKHDLVIGPAVDGGYYLLALKQHYPPLFQGITWSTETVFEKTLAKANQLGLKVHGLETLEDVDDLESWERAKPLLEK